MSAKSRSLFVVLSLVFSVSAGAEHQAFIEVQGHRGCRGLLPENTLPAFEAAIEAGTDVLEMDLAVTRDGVLVISHDPHVNPEICLHSDGRRIDYPAPLIHELDLAEVKTFDCGTLKNPRFEYQNPVPGAKIPTLLEVFALVRESPHAHAQKIGFNIETKIFPEQPEYTVGADEFSALAVKAFHESGFLDRITLQSFDPRTLIAAKALSPSLKTVMLIEDADANMFELGKEVGAFAISPDFSLISKDLVHALQAEGFKVIPWTLNSHREWAMAIDMGVDGIISDYPQALKRYLSAEGPKNIP